MHCHETKCPIFTFFFLVSEITFLRRCYHIGFGNFAWAPKEKNIRIPIKEILWTPQYEFVGGHGGGKFPRAQTIITG